MRSFMREKKIYCGKHYREVDIYPYIVYGADLPADLAASMAALIEKAGGDA